MRIVLRAIVVAACAAAVTLPVAGQQSPAPACADEEAFTALDFWVGEWEVVDESGQQQGINVIEKVLAGCAILEHWTGSGGSQGKSLFYYEPGEAIWKQVWVTEQGLAPGGLKEKQLIESFSDGGVRFQGEMRLADGRSFLDRTTLTPQDDGTVRQHIQQSLDGGATWNGGWVGIYHRRGAGGPP